MSLGSQKEKRDIRIVPIVGFVLLVFIFLELLSQGITYFHYGKPYKSMDPYSFSGYGVYRQNSNYNHKDFVHNSQGFRNIKEFPVERVKGKVRILLAGASVLYAGSAFTNIGWSKRVATNETISFYLSELLNKDYKDKNIEIEVINAGVNRHRIRETLSYLTSELGKYRPDIAIIFGTYNSTHFLDTSQNANKEHFFNPNRMTAEEKRLGRLVNGTKLKDINEKILRVLVNSSAFWGLSYKVMDKIFEKINHFNSRNSSFEKQKVKPKNLSLNEIKENVDFYNSWLGAMIEYLHGIKAVPYVYWEYLLTNVDEIKPLDEIEGQVLKYIKSQGLGLSARQKQNKFFVRDRVSDFVEKKGAVFIDLLDPMKKYNGSLFNDYLHYTAKGNYWVAKQLAQVLKDQINKVIEKGDK